MHDDHLFYVAVLHHDLKTHALFSSDDACLAVEARKVHAFLHSRFRSEEDSLAFNELCEVAGHADLAFLAHSLLELVPCPSAESANACDHFDIPTGTPISISKRERVIYKGFAWRKLG